MLYFIQFGPFRTFLLEYSENFGLQYYLVNEEACFFKTNDFLENKFVCRVLYVLRFVANHCLSFILIKLYFKLIQIIYIVNHSLWKGYLYLVGDCGCVFECSCDSVRAQPRRQVSGFRSTAPDRSIQ